MKLNEVEVISVASAGLLIDNLALTIIDYSLFIKTV